MKERPILMNGAMVRATLADLKTRRKLYAKRGESPASPSHLAARLINGIATVNEHGCWIWGRAQSAGYGSITVARKTVRTHRLAYALASGVDERELDEICHNCPGGDNPLCINPDHLFEGTHGDNVRDAIRKGRALAPVGPILQGESNPAAKLTYAQVAQIRREVNNGSTQREAGTKHGVSQSTVSKIMLQEAWQDA